MGRYSAPELLSGYRYDSRAEDVFAAGVLLFCLMTGAASTHLGLPRLQLTLARHARLVSLLDYKRPRLSPAALQAPSRSAGQKTIICTLTTEHRP